MVFEPWPVENCLLIVGWAAGFINPLAFEREHLCLLLFFSSTIAPKSFHFAAGYWSFIFFTSSHLCFIAKLWQFMCTLGSLWICVAARLLYFCFALKHNLFLSYRRKKCNKNYIMQCVWFLLCSKKHLFL